MRRVHPMPFGTSILPEGGVEFRLWAPAARRVDLRRGAPGCDPVDAAMPRGADGWYALPVAEARPGDGYRFVIDGELAVPDPASRFQPDDVHGPSEVIDPAAYDWADGDWRGRPWHETVLYELHVGTFSPEGTYDGLARRLDHLADLGVTAIELMPLADSPGSRNWGYDGVLTFAPEHRYGRPEALKALVDAAHRRGLMVFVDVVYNHFGPDGNYLHRYAPQYFTERHATPWGTAINFDGGDSRPVRDFFIHNALYWIHEYHIDGLRLDAVHAIHDRSMVPILRELAHAVRAAVPRERFVHLVLENENNDASLLARGADGEPLAYDAQWNDDVHHTLHVIATGETAGYYADYADHPHARLGRALAEGFVYQGEPSRHRGGKQRGTPSTSLPATAFIPFLQNHDQIGNRAFGERLGALAPREAILAATALILLSPSPPLLFMGEEWNAPEPFPFFCDFSGDLAESIREGRRREFAHFPAFADPEMRRHIPDPLAPTTFAAARLDWSRVEQPAHRAWLDHYRRLLALRRDEIMPRLARMPAGVATLRVHDESVIDVTWRLGDGTDLQAIAALTAAPRRGLAIAPAGRLLFATHALADPAMLRETPPWFVAVYLRAGAPP